MERIEVRKMLTYILSQLINLGIGIIGGILFAIIIAAVSTGTFSLSGAAGHYYRMIASTGAVSVGLIFALVFAAIPVNLYFIYFNYRLSLDINAVCEGDGVENESSLLSAVLSTITFGLYNYYWTYKMAQRLRANAPRYGFKMTVTGKEIIALSLFSFGYISTYEMIRNINRVASVYNQTGLPEVVGGVQ